MKPFGPNTILLVVAHPVDLFTSFVYDISGLPATRVIGSGTWLDSIRMSNLLAEKAEVSAKALIL
jgi:L-lactate dehydrogenase